MVIKMLISDLDGTLLGADSRIAPRTADALNRAHQAGLRLLVATGRTWSTASWSGMRFRIAQRCGVSQYEGGFAAFLVPDIS